MTKTEITFTCDVCGSKSDIVDISYEPPKGWARVQVRLCDILKDRIYYSVDVCNFCLPSEIINDTKEQRKACGNIFMRTWRKLLK